MKVAIVFFALVAIITTNSHGLQHVSWSHVPNYNVDWQVNDAEYYIDYGQVETRDHDHTKTNWWVSLPGYFLIKRNDVVNAQVHQSSSQGHESKPVYETEYEPFQYKEEYKPVNNAGYTPTQNKELYNRPNHRFEYKPFVQYKEESTTNPVYKTEYRPIQYKEKYKPINDAENTPTKNKEADNRPNHRFEYKPFVQYKEESINKPVYKTEYKPTQYKEEYKTVNTGYKLKSTRGMIEFEKN